MTLTPDDPSHRTPLRGHADHAEAADGAAATLGVFAKHWTPGATKTRLARVVGFERAAAASRLFVGATLERLATIDASSGRVVRHVVAFTPAEEAEAFRTLPAVERGVWRATPQRPGDLGERMRAFFQEANSRHAPVVLVGSDSPHLPLDEVAASLSWLSEPGPRRLVLGPTDDGGYWMIGHRGEEPPLFEGVPWSDPGLLNATLRRLRVHGWREGVDYRLARRWYDIDEDRDLRRLRAELSTGDATLSRLAERLDALLGPLPD